ELAHRGGEDRVGEGYGRAGAAEGRERVVERLHARLAPEPDRCVGGHLAVEEHRAGRGAGLRVRTFAGDRGVTRAEERQELRERQRGADTEDGKRRSARRRRTA